MPQSRVDINVCAAMSCKRLLCGLTRVPVRPAVTELVIEYRLPVSSLDRVVTWHVIRHGQGHCRSELKLQYLSNGFLTTCAPVTVSVSASIASHRHHVIEPSHTRTISYMNHLVRQASRARTITYTNYLLREPSRARTISYLEMREQSFT